jgi:hypothetical protein
VSPHKTLEQIYSQDDVVSELEQYIDHMSSKQLETDKCRSKAVVNISVSIQQTFGKTNTVKQDIVTTNPELNQQPVTHHSADEKGWPPWPTLKEEDIKTAKDQIYFTKYKDLPKRSTDCDNVKRKFTSCTFLRLHIYTENNSSIIYDDSCIFGLISLCNV